MRRRALLASSGTLLGSALAGCLGGSGGSGPTTTGARTTEYHGTTDDTPETTQFDVTLDVTLERHQPGVLVLGVDSVGVRSDGSQYLYYRVEVTDGDPPKRTDFGFRYGGDVYSPLYDLGSGGMLWRVHDGADPYYAADRGSGWLLFELPAARSAEHAALALGSEEWPVDEPVRERLAAPAPSLSLDWDAPAEQPAGESRFGFTATNDGDRDAWFVGGLNAVDVRVAHAPVAGMRRAVPAGESVSWEVTHDNGKEPDDPAVGDGEPDGRYRLDWTQGEREQQVSFVAPEE